MALRWMDSFDHYATADRTAKYTSEVNVSSTITTSAVRTGTNGLRSGASGSSYQGLRKTLDAQATWTIGAAIRLNATVGTTTRLFGLEDAATLQVDVRVLTDLTLIVTRNGSQLGSASSIAITTGDWHYIELKTLINNSGTWDLHINGVSRASGSGDTQNTANASANGFIIGSDRISVDTDDLYLCDGTGSAPANTFLGDCRVECLYPNGNGNSSQLTGSDGNSTDNYLLVDETAPNGDTDYVESSTVGNKDTYTYGDLVTTTGTVYGVQPVPYAKKTDAGTRTVASVARLSGTEVDSSDKSLSTSYIYLPDIRETKPGGGAWTISDVNSSEFGMKVTA